MMSSRNACDLGVLEDAQARRQSFTTWGMLALAVFVLLGMAEWSKRSAMGEKVVSPQVLERALAIAERMEDRRLAPANLPPPIRSSRSAMDGYPAYARGLEIGNHPSSISQIPSALRDDREANLQTSAGE